MEGPCFRALSPEDVKVIAPQLQVLARCAPEDKLILVETLKELGDVVCVAGDGTNDGPALQAAHVGLTLGIAGTEIAKEASDIILMDDDFSSIVKVIAEGHRLNDFVRRLVQFQVPAKVAIITATLASSLLPIPMLTTAQLLWIFVIVDVFTPLALATGSAAPAWPHHRPDMKSPLFTIDMAKHVFGQTAYQIAILVFLPLFLSQFLWFHDNGDHVPQSDSFCAIRTAVFNAFVFVQIFNTLNSRRLDRKLNVFDGILSDGCFVLITCIGSSLIFLHTSPFALTDTFEQRSWFMP
jgi:Ca2+-transporting ATPase